jgi:hypothetical protein
MLLQQNLGGVCLHPQEQPLPESQIHNTKNQITVKSNLVNNDTHKKKGYLTHEMVHYLEILTC